MEALKLRFREILRFFNLSDRSNNLSITNIAIIVLVCRMATAQFDWPTALGLMTLMLNYMHKRQETNKLIKSEVEVQKYDDLKSHVISFGRDLEHFKQDHEKVAKQAEETKTMLMASNMNKHVFGAARKRNVGEGQ